MKKGDANSVVNAAANARAQGGTGRSIDNTSINTLLKFLRLKKEGASNLDFEMRLGLRPADVAILTRELGIVTHADITTMMTKLQNLKDDMRQEAMVESRPLDEIKEHREKADLLPEGVEHIAAKPDRLELSEARHAHRVSKILEAVEAIDDESTRNFTVPEHEEDAFLRQVHSLGKGFLAAKYNVPQSVILREALRLHPKLDLDQIPS